MTVADDVTLGELERRQAAWEQRSTQEHAALEQHINDLAQRTVPLGVYQADQRAFQATLARLEREHQADIQRVEREHADALTRLRTDVIDPMKSELQNRPQLSFSRWIAILTVVAAFLSVVVAAWATSHGK